MLSLDDAVPYLLARQLIDPACIIDGSLTIQSAASRNGNLKIEGPQGAGLLIKQPVDPTRARPRDAQLRSGVLSVLPGRAGCGRDGRRSHRIWSIHDVDRCLIGLRLLSEAVTLSSFLGRGTGATIRRSKWPARSVWPWAPFIGRSAARTWRTARAWPGFLVAAPWVMTIHRPTPQFLASQSPANSELIRMLQTQNGCALDLIRLHADWRVETVIHGDIRPDNVLVRKARGELPWEVRIIDWEMVQLGEPAWDLAGACKAFARSWVDSMPMTADLSIDERMAQASFPLDIVQASESIALARLSGRERTRPRPEHRPIARSRGEALGGANDPVGV